MRASQQIRIGGQLLSRSRPLAPPARFSFPISLQTPSTASPWQNTQRHGTTNAGDDNASHSTRSLGAGPAGERRNLSQLVDPVLRGKLDVSDLSSKEANQLIWASSKGDKSGRSFQLFDRIKTVHPIYPLSFRYLFISSSHCPERTPELLKELRASGLETTDLVLGGLLVAMCNQGHTDRAIRIFERMLANSGSVAWFESSVLITHLIECDRGGEARSLYERCGAEYEKMLYYKFLHASIAHKDFELASYWYTAMRTHHVRLEGRVLESMLSAGVAAQQYDQVYTMMDQVLDSPAASAAIYEILFRALLKDPQWDTEEKVSRALDYFQRFVSSQVTLTPQSTLLERVLDILASSEQTQHVRTFLHTLHSHHYTVPSAMVYRIAEKFEEQEELTDLIIPLLEDTKSQGTPAVRSLVYYKMIALYVKRGALSHALRTCREMAYVGLLPNTMIYTQLFAGAVQARRVEEAWAMKAMSSKERATLTRPMYNSLVDVAVSEQREELIPALWEEMQAKQVRLDGGPYLEEQLNRILVEEVLPHDLVAASPPRRTNEWTEDIYGQLKDFFLLLIQGHFDEAHSLLNSLQNSSHVSSSLPSLQAALVRFTGKTSASPSSSSSSSSTVPTPEADTKYAPELVEAYMDVALHQGQGESVEAWWEILRTQHVDHSPSLHAYTLLVRSRVASGSSWESVASIHEQVRERALSWSPAYVQAMSQAYGHHQRWDDAHAFLQQAPGGPSAHPYAVASLMTAYVAQGEAARGVRSLVGEGSSILVTSEILRPLIQAYQEQGEEALRGLIQELKEAQVPLSEIAGAFPSSVEARAFLHPSSSSSSSS